MRKPIRIVLAIICLTCCATVSAQVPRFAPYGAWRGRIRYVEGPWRTRTTIHWGNGVTPTGGQVIMHGLTAAENVLRDPDALKKLMGLRDAEAIAKSEQTNSEIQAAIDDIRKANEAIANLNMSVLDAWKLVPTKHESLPEGSSNSQDDTVLDPSDELFEDFEEGMADLTDLAEGMKLSAVSVIAYGEFGLKNRDELELTPLQDKTLDSLIKFARNVADTLKDQEPDSVEASGTAHAAIKTAVGEYRRLVEDCDEATSTSAELKKNGEQLLDKYGDETVLTEGIEFAEDVANAIEQWGDPPPVEDDLFATVGSESQLEDEAESQPENEAESQPESEPATGTTT